MKYTCNTVLFRFIWLFSCWIRVKWYFSFVTCGLCSLKSNFYMCRWKFDNFFFLYCTTRTQFFDSRLSTLTRFAHSLTLSLYLDVCVYYSFFPLLARSFTHFYWGIWVYVCTHTHRPIALLFASLAVRVYLAYDVMVWVLSVNYTCLLLRIFHSCLLWECVRESEWTRYALVFTLITL